MIIGGGEKRLAIERKGAKSRKSEGRGWGSTGSLFPSRMGSRRRGKNDTNHVSRYRKKSEEEKGRFYVEVPAYFWGSGEMGVGARGPPPGGETEHPPPSAVIVGRGREKLSPIHRGGRRRILGLATGPGGLTRGKPLSPEQ